MTVRNYTRTLLLLALFTLGLGGFLLHLRAHVFTHLSTNPAFYSPLISGILSVVVIPLLFLSKKTMAYGYVLNGMLAILGTVTMAHFSIAHLALPLSFGTIMFKTTFADIMLLWGKFFVGKVLFDLELFGYDNTREKKGSFYRYPHLGWWTVHLVVISTVYSLGHILWR
jgi:hypothetical protein